LRPSSFTIPTVGKVQRNANGCTHNVAKIGRSHPPH